MSKRADQGRLHCPEGQEAPPRILRFDESRIDAIFEKLNQSHYPGAAVGIAVGGKPLYRKGFGLASMELPVTLSPSIRMRIMSMSKHFTALAYLLLCESGRCDLDDPIGRFLPELHPIAHRVSMRQLASNTSGLRDAHDISWQFSGTARTVTGAQLMELYRHIGDVNAEPGTQWIYNNGGWLILSTVIERIAGRPLEDVFRERIFEPAGLYTTQLRRRDADLVPNCATSHPTNSAGNFERASLGLDLAGEGGVISTIDDMLRWLAQMDAPIVGSSATWQAMRTPRMLANRTSTDYGLGLLLTLYRGLKTISHAGSGMGCNSYMLKAPELGLDIVVMVNRGDVWATLLTEQILDACVSDLQPSRPSSTRALVSGVFYSHTTHRVVQLFIKDDQQHVSIDGVDMPVEADADGVLWPTGLFRYSKQGVKIIGQSSERLTLKLSDFGTIDTLYRRPQPANADLSASVGSYRSSTAGIQADLSQTSDGPQLVTTGPFGSVTYFLEPLAKGLWRARSRDFWFFGGILSFDEPANGFSFSTQQTRNLVFHQDDRTAI